MEFENDIKNEFGKDVQLNSHIEPKRTEAVLSSNVTDEEKKLITDVINKTDREVTEISDLHNVLIRRIDDNFFVSLHCLAPANLSLEIVHNATSRFEFLMKEKMKEIKRVVIHVEPKKINK